MKVLLVHNFYRSSAPSGEDIVYTNESKLLQQFSIKVIRYEMYNENITSKFWVGLNLIWSTKTYREFKSFIKKERPDLAHFHNIWYLISPSAYDACKEAGIPVVQTLHNFRIFCANGLLLRGEKICEECIPKGIRLLANAIKYGCYKGSRIHTIPIALTEWWHWINKTWINKIDAYITLSEFSKKKFIEAGLPEEKIFVKPNFVLESPKPNYSHKNYAVFLGRLSKEKGVDTLIKAAKLMPDSLKTFFNIKIIGDGNLRDYIESEIRAKSIKNVELLGRKDYYSAMELLSNSLFAIFPSIWYETFGTVICEAFAYGKPVIGSNHGAIGELIEDGKTGLLFEPGNPYDLARKIKWMIENQEEVIQMGRKARQIFEEKYCADRNFQILMYIYQKVLG